MARCVQFLPQGGVVQEGANLDFLEKQARFFAGHDFLLAAREFFVENTGGNA